MRRAVTALLLIATGCLIPPSQGGKVKDAELVKTARDVVALLKGYDCERLPLYLTSDGPAFLQTHIDASLQDRNTSAMDRVCFALSLEKYPRSETMTVRASQLTAGRAVLSLIGTEGESRPGKLLFINREGWKIDHEWALKVVQDLRVRVDLLAWVMDEQSYYYSAKRFTDSSQALAGMKVSTRLYFEKGTAKPSSSPGIVFASTGPDAQWVCGSAKSRSGELFLIRAERNGTATYLRGAKLPPACPGGTLESSW